MKTVKVKTAKLVKKKAFKPKKGEFYFIKNGDIYSTPTPWKSKSKKSKTNGKNKKS